MTAKALDLTLVLFWTSLGVSAVLVGLFLWLMRDEAEGAKRQAGEEPKAASEFPTDTSRPTLDV